jgi:hypothetical protein
VLPLVGHVPDSGRDEQLRIVAAGEESVPDRPPGEGAHLVERHLERTFDRGRLVRRRGGSSEQLKRVVSAPDRLEDPVVLGRDLADLGMRLDVNRASEVAATALLVHVGEEAADLGARPMLGDIESGELAFSVDSERKASVDEREDEKTAPEGPHETRTDADELDAGLLEPARRGREGVDISQESDGERSPDACPEMNGNRSDRIVDLDAFEKECDGVHHHGSHPAHQGRLPGPHDVR